MTHPDTYRCVDGSLRCRRCALIACECTCDPNHPLRQILRYIGWEPIPEEGNEDDPSPA